MKRFLLILICFLMLPSLFGFTLNKKQENIIDNTKYSHAVLNDGKSVTETFALNLSHIESGQSIKLLLKEKFQFELNKIFLSFEEKLKNETDENLKTKLYKKVYGAVSEENEVVCLKITYSELEAWKYYSNSGQNKQTVKRLYTFDYYDQIGKVGGIINVSEEGKLIGEYLEQEMFDFIKICIPSFSLNADNNSSYTYITDMKRRHSNADSVMTYNNMYYHQWLLNQNTEVKFWVTQPLLVSWYVTAVIISVFVFLIIYITGIYKNKKKTTNILLEQENADSNISNPIMMIKIENEKEQEPKDE